MGALAKDTVILMALEKGPGRSFKIEASVGEMVRLGPLEILPLRCYEPPSDERPESAAFLEIQEIDTHGGSPTREIFRGWMFASSPSLSALEHPTHDLWVLDCH